MSEDRELCKDKRPPAAAANARGLGLLLTIALVCCCVAGCGPSGPRRYEVQGSVTLGGRPVPAGEVQFEPDAEKGNTGPQSRAVIQAGKYCTPRGKGAVGGPAVVRVRCYDGKASAEAPMGSQIARPYETKVDLPDAASTQDFEIPASPELGR